MRAKITKRLVDGLTHGEREVFVWDTELDGFGLRLSPRGVITYFVQFRLGGRGSQQRRVKIGRHGAFTPDKARERAGELLRQAASGVDPAIERRESGRRRQTVADLASRYLEQHVDPKNKPSTAAEFRRLVEKHIKPRLGRLSVEKVTRADVSDFHHDMRGTPRSANQALAVLSKMFGLAEVWGLRPEHSNPCRRIEKYKETTRERFLSLPEITALGQTLNDLEGEESAPVLNAVRLLLLTGLRRGEALALRWEDVDIPAGTLSIRDAKAGARDHTIGAPIAAFLIDMRQDRGWVLPASDPSKPLPPSTLEHAWSRIREAASVTLWRAQPDTAAGALVAELERTLKRVPTYDECQDAATAAGTTLPTGLTDVRIHDLRHTVGTFAGATGANAFLVRDLLGHKTLAMTGKYVNRNVDPLRALSDSVAGRISTALLAGGKPPADVVPLKAKLTK